ncbi:hypothetical protein [Xanthomonas hortorum]|uniref:hypothetical protein n=1 Tax=Xanthomonas hortorum TaxID=56454 RepID=UPI002115CC93|nr:hypothetical protein [Xanthomonas hortorum]UUF02524.1 hypothetical protein NDY25_00005 [Xanthomonas hortorum pv. pelargonii]
MAYLIVALMFASFGLGQARAQDIPPCTPTSSPLCSQGQAYSLAAADASADRYCTAFGSWVMLSYSVYLDGGNRYGVEVRCRNNAENFETGFRNSRRWMFDTSKTCSSTPSAITQFLPLNGSSQCWNGCEVKYRQNGDDETSTRSTTGSLCDPDYKKKCPPGSFWNGYMGVCQPIEPDCPEGQVKQDGMCKPENKCPQGMVRRQLLVLWHRERSIAHLKRGMPTRHDHVACWQVPSR